MTLPQRSPVPALPRQATYGQHPHLRPAGVRQHPGVGAMGQRPIAPRPMGERPVPRPAVTFLTVAEVAAMMRVSKMTVYRLVHGGEMAAVRVGRSFRVPAPAVRAYLEEARTDVA